MSKMDLVKVSRVAELELGLLTLKAREEDWSNKKEKFAKLTKEKREDFEILEMLIGDFQDDSAHTDYVKQILAKIDAREQRDKQLENSEDKIVNRLSEFGLDKQDATKLIEDIKQDIQRSNSDDSSLSDLVRNTEMTVRERIDAVGARYEFLYGVHQKTQTESLTQLEKHLAFFSRMMSQLDAKISDNLPLEDLVNIQRYISYAATSYHRLLALKYEMTGIKHHVNYHTAKARLFGHGYVVAKRDEMGRLLADQS